MIEYIRNFVKFFYKGINSYSLQCQILEENTLKVKKQKVVLFCIHRVIDFVNNKWEVKANAFFLIRNEKIYFLKEIITSHEEKVIIEDGAKFDFELEEVTICYSVKKLQSLRTVLIPKSKWKPIIGIDVLRKSEPNRFIFKKGKLCSF